MQTPSADHFLQAVSKPEKNLGDSSLRSAKLICSGSGAPIVSATETCVIFGVEVPGGTQWLLTCYKHRDASRDNHYAAIAAYLNQHPLPFLVPFEYQTSGILIKPRWFPLLKQPMPKGDTLVKYIDENISNPGHLSLLAPRFLAMIQTLEQRQIAHGDLHPANIFATDDHLMLSGHQHMYIPPPDGTSWMAAGSPNYRNPYHKVKFDADLDRFPSIVIYLSLQAISLRPDLWHRYHGSDNLLFKQIDFMRPNYSSLLRELDTVPVLAALMKRFRLACLSHMRTPTLSSFLGIETAPQPAQLNPKKPVNVIIDTSGLTRAQRVANLENLVEARRAVSNPQPQQFSLSGTELMMRPSHVLAVVDTTCVRTFIASDTIRDRMYRPAQSRNRTRISRTNYLVYCTISQPVIELIESQPQAIPLEIQAAVVEVMRVIEAGLKSGRLSVPPEVRTRRPSKAVPPVDHYDTGAYASSDTIYAGSPGLGKRS